MEPLSLAVFTSRLDTHLLGGFGESCLARLSIRVPSASHFSLHVPTVEPFGWDRLCHPGTGDALPKALRAGAALRGNLCKSFICTLCPRQGGSQYQAHPQWELPSHLPLFLQNITALITEDITKKSLWGNVDFGHLQPHWLYFLIFQGYFENPWATGWNTFVTISCHGFMSLPGSQILEPS